MPLQRMVGALRPLFRRREQAAVTCLTWAVTLTPLGGAAHHATTRAYRLADVVGREGALPPIELRTRRAALRLAGPEARGQSGEVAMEVAGTSSVR